MTKLATYERDMINIGTPIALPDGALTLDASEFFRSLWSRTGGGSGIIPSVGLSLAAAGAGQADALALQDDWNEVMGVSPGTGVVMPTLKQGQQILVYNGGANGLSVYPWPGAQIDALGVNSPYVLATAKMQIFKVFDLNQLRSVQLG